MLVSALVLGAQDAGAQSNCTRNNNGSCTFGNNATYAINITITRAVRMALSTTGIALDAPTADEFDATFGQTTGPTLTVKSNAAWTVTTRVTQGTWSASLPPAWAAKPADNLQWSTTGAPLSFTDYTTTNATVQSGVASAGTVIQLYFRVKYSWLTDTPGSYSIPVQFTITSP
jgi:hypothetical protein